MEKLERPIIVPWDFSQVAENAFQHAVNISKALNREILLLHVVSEKRDADGKKGEGKKAKLVFVRRRHRRGGVKWLALLCTDLSLPDEEVVRIYGKRWDIEVFFKMAKHYLKLDSEIQVRDFDSILAHSTIVMMRYIFLAVEQRMSSDERTIGGLFLEAGDELRDLSLTEALVRILSLVWHRVTEYYATSEQLVLEIIEATMNQALRLISPRFCAKCES